MPPTWSNNVSDDIPRYVKVNLVVGTNSGLDFENLASLARPFFLPSPLPLSVRACAIRKNGLVHQTTGWAGRIMLHTRVYFSRMCYQIAPRVLHFSAFINPRRACAARVTLLGLCVVCLSVCYHVFCHRAQQCAQQDILAASEGHEQTFKNAVFFKNTSFRSYGDICLSG